MTVDLKLEKFRPAHKGQAELYPRWVDKWERDEGEESHVGLILRAEADTGQIERLDLRSANIRVVEYQDKIPDIKLLRAQFHRIVQRAPEQVVAGALPHVPGGNGGWTCWQRAVN